MKLNAEEIQKIKTAIIGAKVSCGYRSPYNGARIVTNTGSIKNFSLKTYPTAVLNGILILINVIYLIKYFVNKNKKDSKK